MTGGTDAVLEQDAVAVRAFTARLGLPGLVDVHVHVMPERLQQAVWAYFDARGPLTGREWPIRYRADPQRRRALLDAFGVTRFTTLAYPHKPGMAASLTEWTLDYARSDPAAVASGTLFCEPGVRDYVDSALQRGMRVVKCHVQVGAYDPLDPLLDEAWGLLAEAGTLVVAHVGSGPVPGPHTGPGPVGELMRRHPRLRLVVAHLGYPDIPEFLALAAAHPAMLLDTTMAFTDFWGGPPADAEVLRRLADLGDRVLLGTDFPTIPHPYAHQLEALERLGLGEEWLRAVCWGNPRRELALD